MECDKQKTCSKCCVVKAQSLFYAGSRNKCKECVKTESAAWRAKNRDYHRQQALKWHFENRERSIARMRVNAKKNMARIVELNREWRKNNPEKAAAQSKKWRQKFPARAYARTIRRARAQVEATPKWANTFFMSEAYELATLRTKVTGVSWHVDHIVPLQSPLVCGLHVESNLRVITASENVRKLNRYWPDMP